MPGVIQFVVSLPSVSGLPEDTVNNVLHVGFNTPGYDQADADVAMAAVRDFFTVTAAGAGEAVGDYISDSISRATNDCSVTQYSTNDLTGATPMGSPKAQLNFTLPTALTGTPLPEEIAAVISYNAELTDVPVTEENPTPPPAVIRPQQRRRGRMFIGPLQIQAGAEVSNRLRPSLGFRTDLGLAFAEMADDINAISNFDFGIWSRADAAVYPAVGGYVDDAWDNQRRRGLAPTIRTPFSI